MNFSTKDQDNDAHSTASCAAYFKGAWWYEICLESNLNGQYLKGKTSEADCVVWKRWKGLYYSLKFVEMKIRPYN